VKSLPKNIPVAHVDYQLVPLSWQHWLLMCALFLLFSSLISVTPLSRFPGFTDKLFVNHSSHRDPGVRNFIVARSDKAQDADVIILGTSAAREAFYPENELSLKYAALYDRQLSFVELASGSQTLLQHLLYIKQIELSQDQLVVLLFSPSAFYRSPKRCEQLLLTGYYPLSDIYALEGLTSQLPELESWFEWPAQFNLIRRTLFQSLHYRLESWTQENLYGYSAPYSKYRYSHLPAGDVEILENSRRVRQKAFEGFKAHRDFNQRTLQLLAAEVDRSNATLVLLEQPRIEGETAFQNWQPTYNSIVSDVVQNSNTLYFNINDDLALDSHDFYDVSHLSREGRETWSLAFLQWLNSYQRRGAIPPSAN